MSLEASRTLVLKSIGVPVTIGVLFDQFILDPSREEETVVEGGVTVVLSSEDLSSVLFLSQTSLGEGLGPEKLLMAIDIASKRASEVCSIIRSC